jgi:hypothetical protein
MNVLVMDTPLFDVARLLIGRLKVDEIRQLKWLERGQPSSGRDERKRPVAFREADWFSAEDLVSESVRSVAFRVEARRSLTESLTALVVLLLFAGVSVAGFVFLSAGLMWGVATALLAVGVVSVVYRKGTARVQDAVGFRHELEPVAWALYYAVQLAEHAELAAGELRGRGAEPLLQRWVDLMARIERGADGHALPGHKDKVEQAAAEFAVRLPQTVAALDTRHLFSKTVASRGATAAILVRDELRRGLKGSGRADLPGRLAKRVYGSLIEMAEGFATLPPAPRLSEGLTAEAFLRSPGVEELRKHAATIPPLATSAVEGSWECFAGPEMELPGSRYGVLSAWTGAALVVSGAVAKTVLDEGAEQLADAAVVVGSVLLPGLAGRLAEKLPALASKRPSAPET